MISRSALIIKVLILVLITAAFAAGIQAKPVESPETAQAAALGTKETLRVFEGKSLVMSLKENLKRVSVTNDTIASAIVVTPNQVLIHGVKSGTVTLLLWNDQEQVRTFDLQVMSVPLNLDSLRATLNKFLPGQDIRISQSGSSVMLTGTVSSPAIAEQALAVARTENSNVVSLLTLPPVDQVIMLEVKFAEVQRNAVQQLGVNILSTGALNTPGTISTQQFAPPAINRLTSSIGASVSRTSTEFNLTDVLNIFAFRPDLNLGLMIKALQQKNLLETLAEPSLLALAGKEASFLAGGEFPVPIIQGTTGTPTVSVMFKEFGVRLKFVATPAPDGTINLRVAPEVSSLDYTNAVTLSGFLIPALTTRKADTEVQLKDGQSFAVAGLLDNRVTRIDSKIPWLGDVPILGKLFTSRNFTKGKSELLVLVTPHFVKPLDPGQGQLPHFPVPFLDSGKFEGKADEVPPPQRAPSGR